MQDPLDEEDTTVTRMTDIIRNSIALITEKKRSFDTMIDSGEVLELD